MTGMSDDDLRRIMAELLDLLGPGFALAPAVIEARAALAARPEPRSYEDRLADRLMGATREPRAEGLRLPLAPACPQCAMWHDIGHKFVSTSGSHAPEQPEWTEADIPVATMEPWDAPEQPE